MGNAFYIKGVLSGVQKRDGWAIKSIAIADDEHTARHAIGSPARGWRARVFHRRVRAGGCDVNVWIGVLLRKAQQ